ncbi:MAG: hypothetical protein NXI32_05720 [bacterium]|nr:hypothetical protein [bacterium]
MPQDSAALNSTESQRESSIRERLPGQVTWFDVFSLFLLSFLFGLGIVVGSILLLMNYL